MKKFRLLPVISIILLLSAQIQAQDWEWSLAARPDIPIEISGISMLDDGLTGWAVGSDAKIGRVYHTSDGWRTWEELTINVVSDLKFKDVSFVDAFSGWIVGNKGGVIHTKDSGKTWEIQADSLTANDLRKVSVVDSEHVFACGASGTIIYTKDGTKWSPVNITGTTNDLWGISMYDKNHGVAVGRSQAIFYTTDGENWNPASVVPSISGRDFYAVCMTDQNTAWLVGSGFYSLNLKSVFAKTTDGGDTWTIWEPLENVFENMLALDFASPDRGVAVGAKGCVFVTTDGNDWTFLPRQFGHDSKAVASIGDKIYATGLWGTINYSENFGADWSLLPNVTGNYLYKIAAIDNDRIVGVGYASSVIKTEDGGFSWKSGSIVADNYISQQLWGINFVDSNVGWVAGTDGFIAKTTNGGNSWIIQGASMTNKWLKDIWAYDENNAWIVGNEGVILKSENGGDSWLIQGEGVTSNDLYGIDGLNQNQLAIVGNKNTFLYTSDGGQTWQVSSHNLAENYKIQALNIVDEFHAWAVGTSGVILFSPDMGINWSRQDSLTTLALDDVHFKDDSTGYLVGQSGTIFETTNGGATWTQLAQGITEQNLKAIEITEDNKIFACGYGGVVVRYGPNTKTIASSKEYNFPDDFYLSQNYPNPFNGITSLNYQIPRQSHVNIVVYNMMGQIVATFVNEIKMPGSYKVNWNGSNVPSGIYFVRMKAENFSSVRKVLFVK